MLKDKELEMAVFTVTVVYADGSSDTFGDILSDTDNVHGFYIVERIKELGVEKAADILRGLVDA